MRSGTPGPVLCRGHFRRKSPPPRTGQRVALWETVSSLILRPCRGPCCGPALCQRATCCHTPQGGAHSDELTRLTANTAPRSIPPQSEAQAAPDSHGTPEPELQPSRPACKLPRNITPMVWGLQSLRLTHCLPSGGTRERQLITRRLTVSTRANKFFFFPF